MIKYLLFFLSFINLVISQNYSYYKLGIQRWCTNEYQIHGLWPQYSSNYYPSYCTKDSYIPPVGSLKIEMNYSINNTTAIWVKI